MTKEHILEEIRRTSKTNNGVPLGVRRFYTETGIKEHEWYGKYWVRWSEAVLEAVLEAGFAPNAKTEAYQEEWLVEQLACLAREIGRFPLRGDMMMKTRKCPQFPSEKSFRRFGSKQQLMSKVLDYCRCRVGFDDVCALCAPVGAPEKQQNKAAFEKIEAVGSVYLCKSGRYYKIGKTNSLGRREWELRTQLPEKLKIVHEIRAIDDPIGIEAYWHRRFAAKRKNGEWFDLEPKEVSAFRRRKFM